MSSFLPLNRPPGIYEIAFSRMRGITRALAEQLLELTGSEEDFFAEPRRKLEIMTGTRSRLFDEAYRKELLDKARREMEFVKAHSINLLYFRSPGYPERLENCVDAPLMLFSLGDCDLNMAHIVSIVGTRHATPYGIDFVMKLVAELHEKLDHLVVISGLAYGIDIAAHRAALHNGVPTAAVLAHGLNTVYPAAHRNTAVDIVRSGGALISDYTSQDVLHKGNFLARNRIVAGLCDCLVVAESAKKGGALVTARIAGAYDRDVAALPGRTSDIYSAGCNSLIASHGASLITCADDLIELMGWTPRPTEGTQSTLALELSDDEAAVVGRLRQLGEDSLNSMSVALDMPMHRLMPLLVEMEFKGLLLPYPGGKYRLS